MTHEPAWLLRQSRELTPPVAPAPRRRAWWPAGLLSLGLIGVAGWSISCLQAWQAQEAQQWETALARQAEQHERELRTLQAALAELTESSRQQAEALQQLAENPPAATIHYVPAAAAKPRVERPAAPPAVTPVAPVAPVVPVETASISPAPALPAPAVATPPAEVERKKLELRPEMAEASDEKSAKPNQSVRKFLRSSLFIDSAVLAASVVVPPSLPLALAQSRLGRRLAGKVIKKTNQDGTVAAKVARDIGDMPITQRRR